MLTTITLFCFCALAGPLWTLLCKAAAEGDRKMKEVISDGQGFEDHGWQCDVPSSEGKLGPWLKFHHALK